MTDCPHEKMTTRKDDLVSHRYNKLEHLRAQGIDPYPATYHRSHTNAEAIALFERIEGGEADLETRLYLAGRITNMRGMGKHVTFLDIKDGSGKIQVYFRKDALGEERYERLKDLDLGDIIGVEGKLFRTHSGEITLEVANLTMLAKSLLPPPEKWHGLADIEKRYRQRYLDLIANDDVKAIFVTRSRVISAIRRILDNRGFIEVETPVLQASAGGGMARPFKTYYNALEQEFCLRIALELHLKRLVVGGFDKVYELGRVFRNEGLSTKHNPEFTLLETYEAYADYNDVMRMVEEMVACIAQEALGATEIDCRGEKISLAPPWRRITLRDAIYQYSGVDFQQYPDAEALGVKLSELGVPFEGWAGRGKMIDELLTNFVEPNLIQPTFLVDYPLELSPLAKRKPGSADLVERFEGFMGGMEICNAFSELNDSQDQEQRFLEQIAAKLAGDEEAETLDEDFITALKHGMPPTGGLGIGIERLLMVLTDQQSIREVILFPQLRTREQ